MKTTLVIDDGVMLQLRQEAARLDTTISALVESALRLLFQVKTVEPKLNPLPTFHGGRMLVDISDRDALYNLMDAGNDASLYSVAEEPIPYGATIKTATRRRSLAKNKKLKSL